MSKFLLLDTVPPQHSVSQQVFSIHSSQKLQIDLPTMALPWPSVLLAA